MEPARRRVERREELVGCVGVAADERVEQRRLAGVRVGDQRDAERLALLARAPLRAALALDALELLANALDALADHAPVELDLRLAGAATGADAAALPRRGGRVRPRCGAGWLRRRTSRVERYCSRARSTWSLPSWLRARSPKISRISIVRSATATPRWGSRLRCCAGESAWSKMTTSAWCSWTSSFSSSALPEPTKKVASGALRRAPTRSTTTAPGGDAHSTSS